MSLLAIMQPTYMPWLGYFDLIDQADQFVFLDDVQLARQSWQTRNRIRGPGGSALMLSLPICHPGDIATGLHKTRLDDSKPWRRKQARTIQQAYARAAHGKAAAAFWAECLHASHTHLAGLTMHAVRASCDRLGISTPIVAASGIGLAGDRVDRLIALCEHFGATTYVSPPGAAEYMQVDQAEARFDRAGVQLRFQAYAHPVYDQGRDDFLSHLGIVDLLAHAPAEQALDIIRTGRRDAVSAAHLVEV